MTGFVGQTTTDLCFIVAWLEEIVFYRSMHKAHNTEEQGPRAGYSVAEVSAMAGKHRSWGYRQIGRGRIEATMGFGTAFISAAEVKRIFGVGFGE